MIHGATVSVATAQNTAASRQRFNTIAATAMNGNAVGRHRAASPIATPATAVQGAASRQIAVARKRTVSVRKKVRSVSMRIELS